MEKMYTGKTYIFIPGILFDKLSPTESKWTVFFWGSYFLLHRLVFKGFFFLGALTSAEQGQKLPEFVRFNIIKLISPNFIQLLIRLVVHFAKGWDVLAVAFVLFRWRNCGLILVNSNVKMSWVEFTARLLGLYITWGENERSF